MLPLPPAYPDELAYSVLARFKYRSRMPAGQISRIALGCTLPIAADIHGGGNVLAMSLYPAQQRSGEEVLRRHTLFNYYANTLSDSHATEALSRLSDGPRYRGFGFFRKGLRSSLLLRGCAQCLHDDRKNYGEAYWHRAHQMPGVNRCVLHGGPLSCSEVSVSRLKYPTFIAAEVARFSGTVNCDAAGAASDELRAVELCAVQILNSGDKLVPTGLAFRTLLLQLGIARQASYVQWGLVKEAVYDLLGEKVIACSVGQAEKDEWVWWVGSGRTGGGSPLPRVRPIHLALMLAFVNKWVKYHKISLATATASAAPSRTMLETEKVKYLELRLHGGLRLSNLSIKKYLNKWEPGWIRSLSHRRRCGPRLDWAARDEKLSAMCQKFASELLEKAPPSRVFRKTIISELGVHPRTLRKLPRLRSELRRQMESSEDWKKRKIRYFRNANEPVGGWTVERLLRAASIRKHESSIELKEFCASLLVEHDASSNGESLRTPSSRRRAVPCKSNLCPLPPQ